MRPNLLLAGISLAVTLAGSSLADECVPTTSNPEVDTLGVGGVRYYVDNDLCQLDADRPCVFSIWIYEEGNGIDGLQRGDEVVDDTCGGQIESDVLPCALLPAALASGGRRDKTTTVAGVAFVVLGGTAFLPTVDAC